jgi:uncharacterized membrane protein YtjA (UPF0391 family)
LFFGPGRLFGLKRGAASSENENFAMLKWALIFLVISLVAGALGFTGLAAGAARTAKILFAVFLAIFLVLLVLALVVGDALL